MKMNYQQAERIRNRSFSSLLGEQEGGLGTSLKKTISLKTKAKITGIKEKFDPLNIAKFLTGGSNFAPAVLGKLFGRSREDIARFSGSRLNDNDPTASKLGSLENENKTLDMLLKIYDFMQKSYNEKSEMRKKESAFAEENQMEKQRRHKELIAAITGKPVMIKMINDKENKSGVFGDIFNGLLSTVKGLIATAISGVMSIVTGIAASIAGLLEAFGGLRKLGIIPQLMRLLVSPVGVALLAGYVAGTFMKFLFAEREKDKLKNPKDYEFVPSEVAKNTGETPGQVGQRQKRQAASQVTPKYARELLDAKPSLTEAELIKETGLTRLELEEELKTNPKRNIQRPIISLVPGASPSASPSAMPMPGASPSAMPAESSNMGQALDTAQNQNLNLNIPESKFNPVSVVNNTMTTPKKTMQPTGPLPSVRNQEPTFVNMILYSTKVV